LAIGARVGIAATVGGRESTGVAAASFTAGAMAEGAVSAAAGAARPAGGLSERTTEAARSASRRLRSSETLSVAVVRDAFLAGAGALGLVWTRSGSLIWTCASSSEGWNVKASDAISATDEPARRHAEGRVCANEGVIAARSGKCG
jgi:hypothetical protein